ncbi:MAG: terminase small subunit [Candidatus Latescibacterota bacterium]
MPQLVKTQEYLCDLNTTQAAIRAGYSKRTADVIGYELLRKTSVSQALRLEQDRIAKKIEATAERAIG